MNAARPVITCQLIQAMVAEHYRLPREVMFSRRRAAHLARPRAAAMWLAVQLLPSRSFPEIGRMFDRDHTTVMGAVKTVDRRRRDPAYAADLDAIRERLLTNADLPSPAQDLALRLAERTAEAVARSLYSQAVADPVALIAKLQGAAGLALITEDTRA